MTLIEVMIGLLILSIISIMSMKVLSNLDFSVRKIHEFVENQRGLTGTWRMLEKDFFDNSFISKYLIKKHLYIDKNSIYFPSGVIWSWSDGVLTRKFKNSNKNQELQILKGVIRLELELWQGDKFTPYSLEATKKKFIFKNPLGFKVILVQEREVTSNKIFFLKEKEK